MWQMKMNDTLIKIENFEYPFFCRFNLSQILQYCMDVVYIKEFENNP